MGQLEKGSVPKPRIETLSDLVFGLALSIGAFSLLSQLPANPRDVLNDIAWFGFSFLVLLSVWLRYTDIMSVLPLETRTTLFLNTLMLFLVSLEPYLFNLVSLFAHAISPGVVEYASVILTLDFSGLMIILAFFTHELALEEKGLIPTRLITRYKRTRNLLFVWAAFFLVAALPQFWSLTEEGIPIRFYVWIVPLIAAWITRAFEKPK